MKGIEIKLKVNSQLSLKCGGMSLLKKVIEKNKKQQQAQELEIKGKKINLKEISFPLPKWKEESLF